MFPNVVHNILGLQMGSRVLDNQGSRIISIYWVPYAKDRSLDYNRRFGDDAFYFDGILHDGLIF